MTFASGHVWNGNATDGPFTIPPCTQIASPPSVADQAFVGALGSDPAGCLLPSCACARPAPLLDVPRAADSRMGSPSPSLVELPRVISYVRVPKHYSARMRQS